MIYFILVVIILGLLALIIFNDKESMIHHNTDQIKSIKLAMYAGIANEGHIEQARELVAARYSYDKKHNTFNGQIDIEDMLQNDLNLFDEYASWLEKVYERGLTMDAPVPPKSIRAKLEDFVRNLNIY
jgi:hypothetical protein